MTEQPVVRTVLQRVVSVATRLSLANEMSRQEAVELVFDWPNRRLGAEALHFDRILTLA